MVQLQVIELFVASSDLAVTSVVLRGTLCSIVFYFCCVARDIMQHCVVLLFCWEGHYAAMCCTSVVFARDIMQHCLVLLLCWEGHYAAFFCTSRTSNTNYLKFPFSCSITLLSEVSKKLRRIETSGSAYLVTQYRTPRSALLKHSIEILTTRKYDFLRRVCNFVGCCVLSKY